MSTGGGLAKIVQMILVLVLGGRDPDPGAVSTDDWSTYASRGAPGYAEFNMSELVAASKTTPELKQLLSVATDRDMAAEEIGSAIGSEPAAVKEAFSGIRRIGFWILGLGEDEENIRYQIIIDRGNHADVLPKLIANNPRLKPPVKQNRRSREGYIATVYHGTTIHGFRNRRGWSLWAAERKGKLIIASDRFAVQSFLLHSSSTAAKKKSDKPKSKGIIDARVSADSLFNDILTMLRSSDREEVALVSSFLDFPAWRTIVMRLTKDRLVARARIESTSHLAKVLEPPDKAPAILSAVTDKTDLAIVVAVKSPKALWKVIRSGIGGIYAMEGNPQGMAKFDAEAQRELGLDIEVDIVDIIQAAGYVVPTIKTERDLERRFVLIAQGKEAARTQVSLEKFVVRMSRGNPAQPMTVAGTKIWNANNMKVVQIGTTALLAQSRRDEAPAIDQIIKACESKQPVFADKLIKRFPKASCYGVFNPAFLFKGRDVGRISAGLMFTRNSITLDADYSLAGLAKDLTISVKTMILKGKQRQSEKNLAQIIKGAHDYLAAHGKYPAGFKDMMKYIGNKSDLLVSPVSGKRYKFNSKIANAPAGTIANRDAAVFAHEPLEGLSTDGGGHVLFLSGEVKWLTTAELRKIIAK